MASGNFGCLWPTLSFFLPAVDTDELLTLSEKSYTALHCKVALLFSLSIASARLKNDAGALCEQGLVFLF